MAVAWDFSTEVKRSPQSREENPSLSRLCYQRLWESRNRRALILGWVYYLDAFNNYPLCT
ncbi:hypothetical protein JHK85_043275 [Glycine max]|nr:hypothetical protein JHK85_043275 [Glycine max]